MVETANQMNKDEEKKRKERLIKWGVVALCELFTLISLIYFIASGKYDRLWTCCWTFLIVLIPVIAVKLFHFEINLVFFIVCELYCLAPMLGHSYHFYYLFSWWDDVLHAFAGVLFAILGAYLPTLFCKNGEVSFVLKAFCAFSFSVAVAGLWELVEFSADTFFSTDMQKDTALASMPPSHLLSELLGLPVGALGEVDSIQLTVNGQALGYYIDLGLIDSMQDIFIETLGAAVYTSLYCAGKGKRFCFQAIENKTHPEEDTDNK
jgi:hypothetical protein